MEGRRKEGMREGVGKEGERGCGGRTVAKREDVVSDGGKNRNIFVNLPH